jgi:hypothetical protein
MAKTKAELISDIEIRLSRAKPSDDMEINQSLINFWIDNAANAVLSDHIESLLSRNEDIPAVYVTANRQNSISKETPEPADEQGIRYYVNISDLDVLEISSNHGIVRVTNSGGSVLTPAKYQDIRAMDGLWFSRANKDNMMWYKEDKKIFIDGVTAELYNKIKIDVFYIPSINTSSLADNEDYLY